jgi:hypothetical protein
MDVAGPVSVPVCVRLEPLARRFYLSLFVSIVSRRARRFLNIAPYVWAPMCRQRGAGPTTSWNRSRPCVGEVVRGCRGCVDGSKLLRQALAGRATKKRGEALAIRGIFCYLANFLIIAARLYNSGGGGATASLPRPRRHFHTRGFSLGHPHGLSTSAAPEVSSAFEFGAAPPRPSRPPSTFPLPLNGRPVYSSPPPFLFSSASSPRFCTASHGHLQASSSCPSVHVNIARRPVKRKRRCLWAPWKKKYVGIETGGEASRVKWRTKR